MHLHHACGTRRVRGRWLRGRGAATTVKNRVQSHRPEGRRIAARGGGWWRLELNRQRVVAVCLRAGFGPLAAPDLRRLARSLLQTCGGWPPSLNSNAVGCVWLVGPLGSAGQFISSAALHGPHLGLEFSLRSGRWSRWL